MIPKKIQTSKDEMNFFEHLEVLRWHIIRSLCAVIICAVVVFLFKDFVFRHIVLAHKYPDFWTYRMTCMISERFCMTPPDFTLFTKDLGEEFFIHIKSSFWIGLIISVPFIISEFWRFIKPGLYGPEQKAARGMVFICSFLFILGVLFGYFIISPFAISFLGNYTIRSSDVSAAISSIEKTATFSSYLSFMTMFTIPIGLIFELPVVVYFLAKIDLITPEFMRSYRRHAIIIILLLSAIITPPDVFTQFLIGIPLFILYELSIGIAKRVQKKNKQKEKLLEQQLSK